MKRLGWLVVGGCLAGCAIDGPPGGDDEDPTVQDPGVQDPGTQGPEAPTPSEPEPAEPAEPGPEDPNDPGAPDPNDPPADPPDPNDPMDPPATDGDPQVCYPGQDQSYTTCFPVIAKDSSFGSAYDYPSHSSPSYQPPQRFLDLSAVPAGTKVAPNFTVGELMQEWKGRYALYQVHMVDTLQTIRDQTGGALHVNSGYRSPSYNGSVGGATYSRHMYGDAADMYSSVISLNGLQTRCNNLGADYVGMYSSHVHCDWRYATKDPAFYGTPMASWSPPPGGSTSGFAAAADHSHAALPSHHAAIVVVDDVWYADATGFEEGEPYLEWTAYDADGLLLETVASGDYQPPAGTATVEVMIGGQVMLRAPAHDPSAAMRLPKGLVQVRLDTLAVRDFVQDDVVPSVLERVDLAR